jgi:hypothetical protein
VLGDPPDEEGGGGGGGVTLVSVSLDDDAFAEGRLVELLVLFGEVGVDAVLKESQVEEERRKSEVGRG